MKIFRESAEFDYDIVHIYGLFFPLEKYELLEGTPEGGEYLFVSKTGNKLSVMHERGDLSFAETVELSAGFGAPELRLALSQLIYKNLSRLMGISPPWGILTGVRPLKLIHQNLARGLSETESQREFREKYLVSEEKNMLAHETASAQIKLMPERNAKNAALYISIPFCPSRCFYCSFVSESTAKTLRLIPEYLEYLHKEISLCGEIIRSKGIKITSVYIGGGTPTTLSAEEISALLLHIRSEIDLSEACEFTLEAGRADTITREKLEEILAGGVNRISINPQSMRESVLAKIGRKHSVEDVRESFALARSMGFDNINMDLIAGLDGDDLAGFKESLASVLQLEPDGISIHALAMKRAADITKQRGMASGEKNEVNDMLLAAYSMISEAGYEPYYLYKQKNTRENLENISFAKPGKESIYNIIMMEDLQTVFGVGAGASTKIVSGNSSLHRIYNFKFAHEYIARFGEICEKKQSLRELLENDK